MINWAEYNESLRQRGDLTIWVSDAAQSMWSAPRRTSRGGQRRYSDLAIETCLTLRTAYRLGLRQTQGLMGSIGTLMGLDIRVPDYSTLSRRANGLSIAQVMRQAGSVPVHLVVGSTGLKIFGEGEWLAQKHKIKGIRRCWRKLHLGLDLHSGAIVCANLTDDDVGDTTALPGLLDQLDAPLTGFLADGAYDGASTRDLLRERYGETLDVVIPPPKNAVIRPQSARDPKTAKYGRTRLLVMTLGYSRVRLLRFTSSSRIWTELHEAAFHHLGGRPRLIILDNLREGVINADYYDPTLNPLFKDVLAHYGVVALPCRVRDPDRKGKVESVSGTSRRPP